MSPFFFYPTCNFFPHQSSSDEESGESEGSASLPPSKLAYREGIGVGEGASRGKSSKPPSRPTAPPPSQKLLLQHQQNRKRASALELRLKKKVKWRFCVFICFLKQHFDLKFVEIRSAAATDMIIDTLLNVIL